MRGRKVRSWIGQVALFLVLAVLFSALPFVLALLLGRSSLGLAYFTTWYALLPPLALLLLAWLLYRREVHYLSFVGRAWIGIAMWFLVQYLLGLASDIHVFVAVFNFPAMTVGAMGFLVGTLLFLVGGVALVMLGDRTAAQPSGAVSPGLARGATVTLLAVILVGLPLFVLLTTRVPRASAAAGVTVPTEDEIYGWIEEVYSFGIRRTGSEADLQAIDYLQDKLREFGFTDVHAEYFSFDYWEPVSWSLTVQPGMDTAEQPDTFYVPYSGPTGPEGVTAEMVYVGGGSAEEFEAAGVAGKIVLVEVPPVVISWDQQEFFSLMAHDPDGTVGSAEDVWAHPYPIGWMIYLHSVYEHAEEHGAAGIVAILEDYPDMGEFTYYAPYDGVLRPIPGLYVMEEDGQRLVETTQAGAVLVQLVLDATVSLDGGRTATVYGVLPGQSDTNIFVHSHHDAPWRSGVEDSSGVGMVLSLARYYAQVPEEQRERTMVFAFTGSHMVGAPSNMAFIEEHRDDIMANMLFDLCIEHIADDYNPPLPPTGMVEPRGAFITENPVVTSLYARAAARHGIYRLLVFPTGTPLGVPTDAGPFHAAGYPIVSLISGPTWLFDDDDTMERVARDQLVPLTEMYIDFIAGMNTVGDSLLHFNLNVWTILLVTVVLTPLAAVSVAAQRKDEV